MSTALFEYFPGNENEVYVLHGLLRDEIEEFLGVKFQFEQFELNARPQEHGHRKALDAGGYEIHDGEKKPVTFEYKSKSSLLLQEIDSKNLTKETDIIADWLVCWAHDEPQVEQYVDKTLCIQDVYRQLSQSRKKLIFENEHIKPANTEDEMQPKERLDLFSKGNREKIVRLLENWPVVDAGKREILFKSRNGKTLFRACSYRSQHLNLKKEFVDQSKLAQKIDSVLEDDSDNHYQVQLDALSEQDIDTILNHLDPVG